MGNLLFKYYVSEVMADANSPKRFDEEIWEIGIANPDNDKFVIKTSCGNLLPTGFRFVDNDQFVGFEFDTKGMLDLTKYGSEYNWVNTTKIALLRQPNNAWVWMYIFDENSNCVATFCGHDELHGMAIFADELKKKFGK